MRIAHVSTYPVGGAAIAARRLHEGMLAIGIESTFYTLHPATGISKHAVYQHQPSIWQNISARLKSPRLGRQEAIKANLPKQYDWFSFTDSGLFAENDTVIQEADILILHWVSDWLNWPSFFKAVRHKPVILVMHDMNHVTGGCHYSLGCDQFKTFCHDCPQVEGLKADDLVQRNFKTKLEAFNRENLVVTMPSKWMAENARTSRILGLKEIVRVDYGLDTTLFRINSRPDNKPETVLGFVADSLANHRKGFGKLIEALKLLKAASKPIRIKVMGAHGEGFRDLDLPIEFVGKVTGDENLASFYNSIDLFVIPSSYDNQPNTVVEALCCGVPVVGFPGSGVAEMVENGFSGQIAQGFSAQELADAVDLALQALDQYNRAQISERAHSTYNQVRMAQEYLTIANRLLA